MSDFCVGSELPIGWSWRQLGEITEIDQQSLSGRTNSKFRFCYIDISSVGTGYISEQLETYQFSEAPSRARRVLRDFDILMSTVRPNLKSFAMFKGSNFPTVASTGFAVLSPGNEYDQQYIYACLLSEVVSQQIQRVAVGSNYPAINSSDVKKLWVPFPTLPVRKKIGGILKTIDNQIDATQALIDKYTAIKQGMMADLFSRGIDPETKALRPTFEEAPELYHKTPLGMLPKGWDVEVLGDLASIASGITLGKDLSGVRTVLVPYLRVANVQDGYLDLSEVKSIAVPEVDADKYVLQYGDVLMNEGGDFDKLGRGTVWREEIPGCCHQNHVFRVRADNRKLRFDYLAYWSASSFGKHYFVLNSKQSTNLASINSTQLKAFPVAKPTLEEQEEIESRLQSVDGLLRSSKDELHKLIAQKSGLMQDLLTGKVSVPA
ncbi:restriction endonuclease subunit S [Vibrio cholerae]